MTVDSNYIPQVDYTSRDYLSIRNDLINTIPLFAPSWTSRDAGDFGIVLVEIFAYMGDLINYYIDRAANESFITTATQRDSVLKIAQMLGYIPTDATPSSVNLQFSNTGTSSYTVPALTQVSSTAVVNGSTTNIVFETDLSLTLAAGASNFVTATQGYTVSGDDGNGEIVGTSDGTAGQSFNLLQNPVISNSVYVMVNNTSYSQVPYLAESTGTAAVFTLFTNAEYVTTITFGDNVGGRIPPTNAQIYVTYRVGGGSSGNIGAGTVTNILTNYNPGLKVFNTAGASGGADPESTDSIRVNAPLSIRSVGRAVSLRDYGDLAVQVPGVIRAVANSVVYTNINLYIAPSGGGGTDGSGNLTTGFIRLANNVLTYLSDKVPPNVTVTVLPPTYVGVNITVNVYALPTYKQSTVYTNALKAVNQILTFGNTTFGQIISLHYLMSSLATAVGVDYSSVTLLARADGVQAGVTDVATLISEIPQIGTITVNVINGISG